MKSIVLAVLLALVVAPAVVYCWGAIGHAAIANTAWELMDKSAKRNAYKYLPENATMESIASLADTYAESPQGAWSAHLHYVNMNQGQTSFEMDVDCNNGCVVSAILNNTALLVNDDFLASLVQEPNPFEFIVHFVGDVHQPLHVGWGSDRGGNNVTCYFFGQKTELHAVWDTGIIQNYNPDWSAWSTHMLNTIYYNSSLIPMYTKDMTPSAWADESFAYVRDDVYNYYPDGVASAVEYYPDLGDAYYRHNLPIITERLIAASIRLAALLNKLFA